jgi:hypothetical protein
MEPTTGKVKRYEDASLIQSGFRIVRRRRNMPSVEVLISELKAYGALNYKASLYAGFLGLSFGASLAFGITLTTFAFTNVWLFAIYVALTAVSSGATILFFVLFILATRESLSEFRRITTEETEEIQELEVD